MRRCYNMIFAGFGRLVRPFAIASCLIAGAAVVSVPAQASVLEIQFTGLNLTYDGTNIFDSGSSNTVRNGNYAEADALTSMNFYLDGALVGVLNTDVYADIYIANVGPLSDAGSFVTSGGNGGGFGIDLLTSKDIPGWGLSLNVDKMQFLYTGSKIAISVSGIATDIFSQALPFDLEFDETQPITIVMSSANLSNIVSDGGLITHLEAAGTGNIAGNGHAIPVPEPSSVILMGAGMALAAVYGYRRNRA